MAGKKIKWMGIIFDSELEFECFKIISASDRIRIKDTHKSFIIEDAFEYVDGTGKKRKYTSTVYTPDFILEVDGVDKLIAMEIKGLQRSDYMLRKKGFIKRYSDEYYHVQINSEKEAKKFVLEVEKIDKDK